jgi:hypothetical protein
MSGMLVALTEMQQGDRMALHWRPSFNIQQATAGSLTNDPLP